MIDIDMIYDIWYTQKNKIYIFKSFFPPFLLDFIMVWLVIMVGRL